MTCLDTLKGFTHQVPFHIVSISKQCPYLLCLSRHYRLNDKCKSMNQRNTVPDSLPSRDLVAFYLLPWCLSLDIVVSVCRECHHGINCALELVLLHRAIDGIEALLDLGG